MTASRTSALLGLLAAAGIALTAGAAAAQSGPRSLVPDAAPKPAAQGPQDSDISVDRLEAPGRASAGLLTASESGLPADVWNNADRALIAALLNRMPSYYRSATARGLARRLLLSASHIRTGVVSDNELLARRMSLLLTMGEAQSVVGLAEATGGSIGDPAVAEPLAEAQFALGETESACGTVEAMIRNGGDGYWQKASVFCDLRAGRRADAELMRSVIAESGGGDTAFRDLADALADNIAVTVEGGPDLRALHLAMLAAAPSAALTRADMLPPYLAAVVAASPAYEPAERIAAGEKAIAYAGLSPSVVMLAYDTEGGAQSTSVYREPVTSAMQTQEVSGRAEALAELWKRAGENGDRDLAAGFAAGFLKQMQPSAALAFLAPAAVRMSLLNGNFERASAWALVMRRAAAGGDSEAVRENRAFFPLAQVAEMENTDARKLQIWWAGAADGPDRNMRALSVLLSLDALGRPAAPGFWARIVSETDGAVTEVGDTAVWRQLIMASGGDQPGIALQAVLALIGEDGAGDLSPISLSTAVGALRRIGLETEARQLATEAVIARGD